MIWYYELTATHARVRVFIKGTDAFYNGASCGNLRFEIGDFKRIRLEQRAVTAIEFIDVTKAEWSVDSITDPSVYVENV